MVLANYFQFCSLFTRNSKIVENFEILMMLKGTRGILT